MVLWCPHCEIYVTRDDLSFQFCTHSACGNWPIEVPEGDVLKEAFVNAYRRRMSNQE